MNAVVYADFSCPACYLASLRVDPLLAAGRPVPDWRAVEHRPRLPVTGVPDPIRDFGYAVTSQREPITHAAYSRVRQWQQDWLARGAAVALTLETGTATLTGEHALGVLTVPSTEPTSSPSPRRIPVPAGQR